MCCNRFSDIKTVILRKASLSFQKPIHSFTEEYVKTEHAIQRGLFQMLLI